MTRSVRSFYSTDETGAIIPLAEIKVNFAGGAEAPIFTTNSGGTAVTQPLISTPSGKAVFYVEPGVYDIESKDPISLTVSTFFNEEVGTSRADLSNDTDIDYEFATTEDLINNVFDTPPELGSIARSKGYAEKGDGGSGRMKCIENTGAGTPSQSPAQLADALFNDGDGNQWALVNSTITFASIGGVAANDNALVFSAAMNAISGTGKTLIGDGQTYNLTGDNELLDDVDIRDIRFKQSDPLASDSTRTINSLNKDNIKLNNVYVNMGDEPTAGLLANSYSGISINGGSGHKLIDLEVEGSGSGHGIRVINASDFQLVRPYVHDIDYLKSVTDDTLEGIRLQACDDFQLYMPEVKNLHGDPDTGDTTRFTRGIALTGCSNYSIGQPSVSDVGQGIDQSGNVANGNINFTVTGGNVKRCFTWGYKYASSSSDGVISACIATDCGYAGFVCSGGVLTGDVVTSNLDFVNCKSINSGSNGEFSGNNPAGFLILQGDTDPLRPYGIKFTSCKAIDKQDTPTMVDGFRNQVDPQSEKLNECFNCESIGHTGSAFNGIHFNSAYVYSTADQEIINANSTPLSFNQGVPDTTEMRSGTRLTPKKSGTYRIEARVTFEANATGLRIIDLRKNGSALPRSSVTVNATPAGTTYITTTTLTEIIIGDYIEVEARQESGGALDVLSQGTSLEMFLIN